MILVALGANLSAADGGAPLDTCRAAAAALDGVVGLRLRRVSRWYDSAPVPPSDQPHYVNGVARLEGEADPAAILADLRDGIYAVGFGGGQVDITNGNSGSSTLNAKGEFVGLAFDGTLDGVIADWQYDPTINRTIHVDSRFMLWTMDKVDGAQRLLREMGVM